MSKDKSQPDSRDRLREKLQALVSEEQQIEKQIRETEEQINQFQSKIIKPE